MNQTKEDLKEEIQDKQEELEPLYLRVEELENCDNTDEYDEMLDDCHGILKIGCIEIYPSVALEKCDPIAYSCGHSEYNDSLLTDVNDEVDSLKSDIEDLQKEIDEMNK